MGRRTRAERRRLEEARGVTRASARPKGAVDLPDFFVRHCLAATDLWGPWWLLTSSPQDAGGRVGWYSLARRGSRSHEEGDPSTSPAKTLLERPIDTWSDETEPVSLRGLVYRALWSASRTDDGPLSETWETLWVIQRVTRSGLGVSCEWVVFEEVDRPHGLTFELPQSLMAEAALV